MVLVSTMVDYGHITCGSDSKPLATLELIRGSASGVLLSDQCAICRDECVAVHVDGVTTLITKSQCLMALVS